MKVAAKFFGTKFACGSSVTGDDEIVIQGDVKDDLFDIIPEKWPEVIIMSMYLHAHNVWTNSWFLLTNFNIFQIDEDSIEDLGDQKR